MSKREVDEWFWQLTGEMLPLTEELGSARPRVASARFWEPRVDLIEEQNRFLLKAEIAGVRGEDIQIVYIPDRHSIIIRGVRAEGDVSDGSRQGVHQLEIYYGEYQREVKLPDGPIEAEAIRARYRNGFLFVLIPKKDRYVVRSVTVTQL
ncbi:MAG TPA: Hsp20/alpha crystallin family protein [Fimbriimonas sp.]|nr:Hsp20/alpha crystallin family protein [Fimbriimonas sp.]